MDTVTPESVPAAAAAVRAAAAADLAVVARGSGSRQSWGTPPRRLDVVLDTTRLSGVVEHVAGDLVAVVRAGTPMGELAAVLAGAGQQLAIDAPPGVTVGGTVALAASGPRRLRYGTVRDLLIGITVVRPDGAVVKAGGKVVKNVAGYDLGKLYTGSYGTLGLIVECVFRLHPLPAARLHLTAPATLAHAAAVRASQVAPSAVEIDSATGEVCVLLEGTPAGLPARAATVRGLLGDCRESPEPPDWWGELPWEPGGVGIRLTGALSRLPALVEAAVGAGAVVRGSAGVGVLYAGLPPDPDPVGGALAAMRAAAHAAGGHAVVLTAPDPVRDRVDMWGPVPGIELMRRVKERFDPHARFAPGRFVGGI